MTLREFAAQLGLGKSTVADALRGKAGVSAETRERVQQAARELGYEPNPLTSALLRQVRSGSSPRVRANVAVLLDYAPAYRFPYMDRLCRGFRARAMECGLVADEINTRKLPSTKVMRILLSRGIEGVAALPLPKPMGHRTLDWSKFAAVSFGYTMARPQLHLVVHNHLHGVRTAFRMCRKKGFRRIGLALDQSSNMRSNGLWTAGYLEIQQLLPKTQQVRPLLLPDTEFTPGRIGRWIGRERPEAVLIHRMDPKILLDHSKPAVPVFLDHRMDGPYAGIDQEYDRLGAVMADLLARQMIRNERGIPPYPTVTLLEGTWIDHPSLDPDA